ncbi:hypothetical protein ACIA5A_05890 [Micromonospora sp. NPDC051300]|uniref:hypothetical protein n=1 Tax=Micromonospora sp. NPDC051300 TaxID=3364286 RepID=UPI0037BCE90C
MPASPDPHVRHYAAVIGGLANAAGKTRTEHEAAMAHARAAQLKAIERNIDPDGRLAATDPHELARLVDLARRERFARMGLRSAQARAQRRSEAAAAGAL